MNVELEVERVIEFVRDYYKKNNLGGCVIGISGGKDSAVVAAIMCRAIGSENVLGLTLPCHSNDDDRYDAELVSKFFGFELLNCDLTDTFDVFRNKFDYDSKLLINSDINFKPKLRTATLYYYASLYSCLKNKTYIVVGTSNKSELFVGYFTKGGDSVHDIEVISDFTVSEVIKIGEYLNVPEKVLYKTPSDGLSNKSDEDKLGVSYSDIEKVINNEDIDINIKNKILKLHNNNQHKFNMPMYKR